MASSASTTMTSSTSSSSSSTHQGAANALANLRRIGNGIMANSTTLASQTVSVRSFSHHVTIPPRSTTSNARPRASSKIKSKGIAILCTWPHATLYHGLASQVEELKEQGFGLLPGMSVRVQSGKQVVTKSYFDRQLTARQFKQELLGHFPRLIDFKYQVGKANSQELVDPSTQDICPRLFGIVIRSSRLYIVPTKVHGHQDDVTPVAEEGAVESDVTHPVEDEAIEEAIEDTVMQPVAEDRPEDTVMQPVAEDRPEDTVMQPVAEDRPEINICLNGLHTVAHAGDVCMICQQNDEFSQALIDDQAQDRRRLQVEEQERIERETSDSLNNSMNEMRSQATEEVLPEVDGGRMLHINFPNYRIVRGFNPQSSIQDLIAFVRSQPESRPHFQVMSTGEVTLETRTVASQSTIHDVFSSNASVHVQWDDDSIQEVLEVLRQNNDRRQEIHAQQSSQEESSFAVFSTRLTSRAKTDSRPNIINVKRSCAADDFFEAITQPSFDPRLRLDIKFMNDNGDPEEGIDEGGLTAEMLSIAMEAVRNFNILNGPSLAKNLIMDMEAYVDKKYDILGLVIGLSLLHRGPALDFLCPTVLRTLAVGPRAMIGNLDIDDMRQYELISTSLLDKINRIEHSEDVNMLYIRCMDMPFLQHTNCHMITSKSFEDHKKFLINVVIFEDVLGINSLAYGECRTALARCGILEILEECADTFVEMCRQHIPLKAADILGKLRKNIKYTDNNELEKQAVNWLEQYVLEVEDGKVERTSLEDLFHNITGMSSVGVYGMPERMGLDFKHDNVLPKFKTCANTLYISTKCKDYVEFRKFMTWGIHGSSNTFSRY